MPNDWTFMRPRDKPSKRSSRTKKQDTSSRPRSSSAAKEVMQGIGNVSKKTAKGIGTIGKGVGSVAKGVGSIGAKGIGSISKGVGSIGKALTSSTSSKKPSIPSTKPPPLPKQPPTPIDKSQTP